MDGAMSHQGFMVSRISHGAQRLGFCKFLSFFSYAKSQDSNNTGAFHEAYAKDL